MSDRYQFAYLILSAIYAVFAIFCLVRFKRYRVPLLVTATVMAFGGPLNEFFYIPGYWNPRFILGWTVETGIRTWRFGFEDFLGAFSFSALSVALFEGFYRKPVKTAKAWHRVPILKMSLIGLSTIALSSFFFFACGWNGFYSCTLSLTIVPVVLLILHPSYLRAALPAALASAIIYWLVLRLTMKNIYPDIFVDLWNPAGMTGFAILGIPVEEPLWAFLGTLLAGPVYRLTHEQR